MTPLDIYNEAISRVPAYKRFLTDHLGTLPDIKSMDDFAQLPLTSKADYIMNYSTPDLCMDGSIPCAHLWLRSSGTSKKPFFWPRRAEDEQGFPAAMRKLFHDYVSPDVQPTLIVVGLALGPWGTGMQSSYAFRMLARETPGLAVVSPGLQNDSIIEVLERLSPHYKQTLFLCYPPFAKMVLEEAASRGVDVASLNIHLMVGGEGITESYRERMWKLLGHSEQDLHKVWCLYGSTDFANVGFENPLTIAARRMITSQGLWETIFDNPDVPMLFQRVPTQTYFEIVDGELVVTRLQGIPLIRYRSGDHVKFIERDELLSCLKDAGCDAEQAVRDAGLPVPEWKTPFVALYGRIDHAVFFYGAKITVEQVKAALDAPSMVPYYNGRFLVRGVEGKDGNPIIEISLEDCDALRKANLDEIAEVVACELEKVQSEFREVRKLSPNHKHIRLIAAPVESFELGWKTRHM
jgi:phenylacetate-CoA ligase